jgi:3-oxoacyl-[acyl-carrier protein] reductase
VRMKGKVVLITGGSRGIGRALAESLVEKGHRIVITGRDEKQLFATAEALGEQVLAVRADASGREDTRRACDEAVRHFGTIDVLINNAGISGVDAALHESDPDLWWRVQEINLRGPMLYMRTVLPLMIEQGSGTVINMGSYAAIRPIPGASAYSASKIALARMSDIVADEVREHGIDVFCVSPGLVLTDMTRGADVFDDLPPSAWSPIDRICELVGSLVDRDCSALSGRFIHVNDDLDELLADPERVREECLYQLRLSTFRGVVD